MKLRPILDPKETTGSLCILNVGAGDIQIAFNKHSHEEVERARSMIEDMLTRGYALLVKMPDGTYQRAVGFDAGNDSYIVSDSAPAPSPSSTPISAPETQIAKDAKPSPKSKRGRRSMPVSTTHAVGVARSAGG